MIDLDFFDKEILEQKMRASYIKGMVDKETQIKEKVECWCWRHEDINQDDLNELLAIVGFVKEQSE